MHQTPETLATVAGSPSVRLEAGRPCAVVEGKRAVGRGGSAGTGWVPWGGRPGRRLGWRALHALQDSRDQHLGVTLYGRKVNTHGRWMEGSPRKFKQQMSELFCLGHSPSPLGPVAALGKGKMGRRDRGPQMWRKVRDPTCSPLPFLHSRLLRAGEHLLQAGEPHRPPEAESRVAPRW